MTTFLAFEIAALILGLLFGSFLNVCIARLPKGESIVTPGSYCPNCRHLIRWYDNVPVLNWLLLRGKCRDCKAPIAWQYPLIEIATGLWFAAVVLREFLISLVGLYVQLSIEQYASLVLDVLSVAILGFLLIGLLVMDWQTHLLPDAFTFTGIVISFLLTCIRAFFLAPQEDQIVLNSTKQLRLRSPGSFAAQGNVFLTGPEHMLGVWLLAVLGAAAILLLIRWAYQTIRHREGMGLGDVKLLAMIAGFLGFWPAVLTLFLGTLLATAYVIFLLARGKANAATRLPLGSFLCAGGLIASLFGSHLINSYRALLH